MSEVLILEFRLRDSDEYLKVTTSCGWQSSQAIEKAL